MGTHLILCLCLSIWAVLTVSGENVVLSLETIRERGLKFSDMVDMVTSSDSLNATECIYQLQTLSEENPTALAQIADSWSVFPYSGALHYASKTDWGNYDECMKVGVTTHDKSRIIGRFCAWGFMLPDLRPNEKTPVYLLSYCVPDKCTGDDLNDILKNITNADIPLFNDKYCSTKDTDSELDVGAIVSIILFLVIFVFMMLSTAYDVYLFYAEKESIHPILTAFSIFTNGKRLLQSTKYTEGGEQILCFHGMKFISMWWIISGHGAMSWFLAPISNLDYRQNWQSSRYSEYITTAHISVDTFFYISGFLMAYLYFKGDFSKKHVLEQIKVVPSSILHRYLRLTPVYAMCFFGSVYLFKYLNDGPFFSYGIRTGLIEPCKQYWWTYFLYIQNYYNFHYSTSLCIPTTWYLSADMQLFLVTPFIIIPLTILYYHNFIFAMAGLFVTNLVFFVLPIFIRLQWRDYDPDFQEYDFHSKLISYFMGIMMGMYMRHEKNKRVVISTTVNLCLWFLALGTMAAVMFYREQIQLKNDYVSRSLCYSFTRPMWCFALSWITYACVHGYGGIVNWFLSSPFMQLGGKLTYCIYIVHGMVIAHFSLGVKSRLYFSDWHIFYQNCGYFVISMMIATVWSLAFELPMITIERFIFGTGKPKVSKPTIENKPGGFKAT